MGGSPPKPASLRGEAPRADSSAPQGTALFPPDSRAPTIRTMTRAAREKDGGLAGRDAAGERALRRRLLAWFRREARDLPWRRVRDPYAIWISEAMLQQTRVETVRERYGRFLARFPDAESLARASEEEVLAEWSGLGYYGRARRLREAARVLLERHRGLFPRTRREALALPGVGPYTAAAVLSIAYDLAEPLVDGNVERVLARLDGLAGAAASPRLRRAAEQRARQLVPRRGAGEWNQALMELGATVCTPRAPRCEACPLVARCLAFAAGDPERFPAPRPRRAPQDVRLEVLLVHRRGRWLLVRRPPGGSLGGMLEPPARAVEGGEGLFPLRWPEGLAAPCGAPTLGELRHAITHHRIRARVRLGEAREAGRVPGGRWARPGELERLELTGLARKALEGERLGRARAAARELERRRLGPGGLDRRGAGGMLAR